MLSHQDAAIVQRWNTGRWWKKGTSATLQRKSSILLFSETAFWSHRESAHIYDRKWAKTYGAIRTQVMKAISHVSAAKFADFKCHAPLGATAYHDTVDRQTFAGTKPLVTIYSTGKELKDLFLIKFLQVSSSFASAVTHRRWKDAWSWLPKHLAGLNSL